MLRTILLLLGFTAAAYAAAADEAGGTPAARAAAQASFSAVLQGDANAALRSLAAVPAGEYAGKSATYRSCMKTRFERTTPPPLAGTVDEPFARAVLLAYQQYWWRALKQPGQEKPLGQALQQRLRVLLGGAATAAHDADGLEPILATALRQHGYYALQGVTPPLRELMLWHRQDSREVDVTLPEGTQHVTVNLLGEFASEGWSDYGSCGLGGTGGWTDDKAIYALAPSYPDPQAENYRVSLLAHEGQHFADKQRGWKLQAWELEYRAKLTELTLAEASSKTLLQAFAENQGDDPGNPHAYANRRVLQAIAVQLGLAPDAVLKAVALGDLQHAARSVFLADTRRRQDAPEYKTADPATAAPTG